MNYSGHLANILTVSGILHEKFVLIANWIEDILSGINQSFMLTNWRFFFQLIKNTDNSHRKDL